MESAVTRRRLLAGLPYLLAGTLLRPAVAAPVFPEDYRLRFTAEVAGAPAGTHLIALSRDQGRLTARSESRLLLPPADPAGGAPRAFRHFAEETWAEGWLQGLVSDSRIGARRHQVRAWRRDKALRGTRDGQRFTISGYLMTASGWHRDTPRAQSLVDAVDGRLKRVRGHRRGRETVETGWGPVTAERWVLVGELQRELWYDAAGRLIRFALPTPGGPLRLTAAESD